MDYKKTLYSIPGIQEKLYNLTQKPLLELPVLYAKIKILWQCNLSCKFCELPKPKKPLSKEIIAKLIKDLK